MAIVAVVVVAILLVGGGAVAQLSFVESGTSKEYTETFDAGAIGDIITFNESNRDDVIYEENVIVESKNNKLYVEGEDYTWYQNNGTLEVLSSNLANTTDNTIDYVVVAPTLKHRENADRIASLFSITQYIPLLLLIGLILIVLGVFGSL